MLSEIVEKGDLEKTARQTFLYAVSSIVLHQCRDYFPSLEKAGAAVNRWTVEPTEASTEVTPSNWEQLGATGSNWEQLGATGSNWEQLGGGELVRKQPSYAFPTSM
jgi:hypothetical protein